MKGQEDEQWLSVIFLNYKLLSYLSEKRWKTASKFTRKQSDSFHANWQNLTQ